MSDDHLVQKIIHAWTTKRCDTYFIAKQLGICEGYVARTVHAYLDRRYRMAHPENQR